MIGYFLGVAAIIAFYAIIINTIHSGRCFRYEYIVKTLAIIGLEIVCFVFIVVDIWPILKITSSIALLVLMFYSLKFTIQRFYDLDLSGRYILLKLIPVFSIVVTLYLYFKKSNYEINGYDQAIDYKKLLKNKCCIDIHKDKFIINHETYQYEMYIGNYIIKISKYSEKNIFADYLLENYQYKEENIYKIITISQDELGKIINTLGLVAIYNSFYLKIKEFEVFIRKEDFKYTIILNKNKNNITKELFDFFNFPGSFFEEENYIYYKKIDKKELLVWVKNGI